MSRARGVFVYKSKGVSSVLCVLLSWVPIKKGYGDDAKFQANQNIVTCVVIEGWRSSNLSWLRDSP